MNKIDKIKVLANAKINLSLKILGKLPNGYHLLHTVMQSVSLGDKLEIKLNNNNIINITCDNADIPTGEKNIAYKAAKVFFKEISSFKNIDNIGVDIFINKNIPEQAGMAGGSADAAGVLFGLNKIFDDFFDKQKLCSMGASLGADVAFCVKGGCQICTGRGEIMQAINGLDKISNCYIVVTKPKVNVSTPFAYGEYDKLPIKKDYDEQAFVNSLKNGENIASLMFNAFEEVIAGKQEYNSIFKAKEILLENGALGAIMTGSGSAVFGIFESKQKAEKAKSELENQQDFIKTQIVLPCENSCSVIE